MIKRIMLKDMSIAKMVKWDGSDESLKEIQELLPSITIKRDDELPGKQINLYFGYRTEHSCTFYYNYIVLYPNGKVDIVDENWLMHNTYPYVNSFIKRKYVYFVSGYISFKNGEKGFSNCEVKMDEKITRNEQIIKIAEQIKKDDDDEIDNYILTQYKLLRVEEEEE